MCIHKKNSYDMVGLSGVYEIDLLTIIITW